MLVNADGATTNAPVPGGSIRSIDQEPLLKVDVLVKDEVLGFHKETLVPSGGAPSPVLENNELRSLVAGGDRWVRSSGLLNKLLPAEKTLFQ